MPVSENMIPTPLLKQVLEALERSTGKVSYGWTHLMDGRMVDGQVYTLLREMGREPKTNTEYKQTLEMVKRLATQRREESLL